MVYYFGLNCSHSFKCIYQPYRAQCTEFKGSSTILRFLLKSSHNNADNHWLSHSCKWQDTDVCGRTSFRASLPLAQCTLSGKQSNHFVLLGYERSYHKSCVKGGIYVAIGHAIDADFEHMILHYFIVVLCSPEQMYSPTVQRVLIHRYLHSNVISI